MKHKTKIISCLLRQHRANLHFLAMAFGAFTLLAVILSAILSLVKYLQ